MQIIKLDNRHVVLVEEGEVRLAQLPTGVFYSPAAKEWRVLVPKKGGGWNRIGVRVKKGIISSFDEAVKLREDAVGVLVKRRLIKRYFAGYTGRLNADGYYYVTDPITGTRRRMYTLEEAVKCNQVMLDRWLDVYQIDLSEIYKEIRNVGNKQSSSKAKITKTVLEKSGAQASTHHYI